MGDQAADQLLHEDELKIIACLSWFEERPDWLYECITSLQKAGVDHVVATDGAYGLFKGAKRRSTDAEHEAIREAAEDAGLGLTVKVPPAVWDSEVSKRGYMFRAAERIAEVGRDWYFVVDADCVVMDAPDVPQILPGSTWDLA